VNPPGQHRPRLLPEEPFPSYSYVPGQSPHPVSDPRDHNYGSRPEPVDPPDPERWRECRPYLYGIDLFNHGFYWEAHETWESLWHACGRHGPTADFLKGLIKLAAAGVKAREGQPRGVRSHARRAAALFEQSSAAEARYMGLPLRELIDFARELASRSPDGGVAGVDEKLLLDLALRPA
jgi:hypothetical protein